MEIGTVLAPLAAVVMLSGCAATSAPTPTPTTEVAPTTTTTATASWPDAGNTGVPPGTTLTASGGVNLNTPGQVVDGLDIAGPVTINADGIVLRRSRVRSSSLNVIKVAQGAIHVRIEDVEVNGSKAAKGSNGIEGPAAVVRADIQGVENGILPGNGSLIQDSWIHDLGAPGRPHIDGIQIDGGLSAITIRHNTVDLRDWTQTAAVMIDNYSGPADTIVVDGNRLLGGGYTVYSDGRFKGGPITGVRFTGNRLGRGKWGYASISVFDVVWSGNVDDKTGATIPRPGPPPAVQTSKR